VTRRAWSCLVALAAAGCGGTDAPPRADTPDASAVDAAAIDAGALPDAPIESVDAGEADAGLPVADDAGNSNPWADAAAGDGGTPGCAGPGSRFVTDAVDHAFGGIQTYNQDKFPGPILGPPKGGGARSGSLDVVSLGDGGHVTVAFAGNTIVDGPGVDFIVFENAFDVGGDPMNRYAEPGTVGVSQDGATWVDYPCTATAYPWGQCAGWHPVFANADTNTIDPTDPAVAGGDPYDLADVGLAWARYVRITDRPGDGLVFDLDAVAIVHPSCP